MKWFDDIKKYYLYRGLNKRFVLPVWVLVMIDSGLSLQEIAIITAISGIVSVILEVPSGSIADTIGHKNALIIAMFFQGTSMLFFLGGSFWWIAAASWGYFGLGTLMTGTHQALFYERLQELGRTKEYQRLMGRARSFSSGFSMVSVLFAGLMYVWSPALTFFTGAILFWAGGVLISTFGEVKEKKSVSKDEAQLSLFSHFGAAWKNVQSQPKLLMLIVTNSLILGATYASAEFQQVIFTNIGLAISLFGVMYGLKRFFSMIISPLLHLVSERMSSTSVLAVMSLFSVAYFLLIGSVSNHVAIFGIVLLASFTIIVSDVVIGDFLNKLIPTGSRATTLSISNLMTNLVKISTVFGFGLMTTFMSIELAHIYIAVALGGIAIVLLPITRRTFIRN